MPASGPTSKRSWSSKLLIRVDLPIFGRPTMAMRIGCLAASSCQTSTGLPSASSGASTSFSGNSASLSSCVVRISSPVSTPASPCVPAASSIASCRSTKPSPCAAEIATGSPSPSVQLSATPLAPILPSHLLQTRTTCAPDLRISPAKNLSTGVIPTRASTTSNVTSASAMAISV